LLDVPVVIITAAPVDTGKKRDSPGLMKALAIRVLSLVALLLVAFPVAAGMAQEGGATVSSIAAEQRAEIESLKARVDGIENRLASSAEDDAKLVDLKLQLDEVERALINASVAFRPRLAAINSRIEQLGPAPPDGQAPEPEIAAAERKALTAEKAEINAVLGVAEDLSIRVGNLISRITEMRRELFSNLLTKRYDINFTLGGEVLAAARTETAELFKTVGSWLRFVFKFKLESVLGATFFALFSAAIILIGGRRVFGRLIEADPDVREPSYLSRLSVAFWSTLLPTAALSVFLTTTYLLYDYFGVLRGDIGVMLTTLFIVIGLIFFVHRLAAAVLSPRLPQWRLIAVESRAARILFWLVMATVTFTAIDVFLSAVYEILDAPLALTVGESLVATVLTGIPVILVGFVRPFLGEDGKPRSWNPLLRIAIIAVGAITILAALSGYVGFARFVASQIVVTGATLATMYIGFLSARAVSDEGAFAGTAFGRRMARIFNLDESGLDQISLLVSIAINVLIVAMGVPLILFLWGFQPGDISAWAYKVATGIKIGSFTFSLTGILWGILVFGLGFFVTRWFQGWLDGSVMARGKVDAGVRNSIRTVVGYAGVALAGLVAISAAGIDLSNLALIAGGLSLGIGFGLQNVVSNFVSGLILLAERPFKAGDWIVAGDVTGTVKKISVRATEIETFQRQTVILPNSELINRAVGNWTHRNKIGRVDIKVGVAYGNDVKRAHAILTEIAQSHPLVLRNPEPFVLFANFGTASLEFEIRVFLADVTNGNIVQNDIRFAIMDAFAREGLEIPSTPRWQEPPSEEKWPADDEAVEAEHMAEMVRKAQAEAEAKKPRGKRRGPDPA